MALQKGGTTALFYELAIKLQQNRHFFINFVRIELRNSKRVLFYDLPRKLQ